jgi:hypothetical protein
MRLHVYQSNQRRNPYRCLEHFLTKNHFYPLVFCRNELYDLGVEVRFFGELNRRALDCDALFLASRQVDTVGGFPYTRVGIEKRRAMVHELRERTGARLIWFDLRDSGGTPQFEVLPYVDLYCKQMLYKDRDLYRVEHYGGRVFSDYFHRNFNVDDGEVAEDGEHAPLPEAYEHKLCVFWDVGASYNRVYAKNSEPWNLMREVWSFRRARESVVAFHDPRSQRAINMSVLLTVDRYNRESVSTQRRIAIKIAQDIKDHAILVGRVPRVQFGKALIDSKIVLSCFGNGEICLREHEAWQAGAAVLMPDMSHLEVWPERYIPGQTYMPLEWDLSNLEECYWYLRNNEEARLNLAIEGQRRMMSIFGTESRQQFSTRVKFIASGVAPAG